MDLGVVFPQLDIGPDPEVVRDYARTAEAKGYRYCLAYDHVVGGDVDGPYDHEDQFHEPLTLFANLAGATEDLEFVTGVIILPQRQTVLVAKQAAEVDVLSGGRLHVGVGVGWNELEYESLGMDFATRGKREDAQIPVLRKLWTEELVEHEDEFHSLPGVGLSPMPVQRSIPLYVGGTSDPALRRAARLGDGWLPQSEPGGPLDDRLERVREYAREYDRDPDDLTVIGRMKVRGHNPDEWVERLRAWRERGVTGVCVNTMPADRAPEEQADLIAAFADAVANSSLDLDL